MMPLKVSRLHSITALGALLFAFSFTQSFAEDKSQNETLEMPVGLISSGTEPEHFFLVDKTKRVLSIYKSGEMPELVAEYPTDIGKNSGDKIKENDHKTPVGIYFLLKQVSPPEVPFDLYGSLAFTTDYPNIFDRRDAKTGSGIWLHAIPDSVPLTRGSRGCVVVRNDVIQKLKSLVILEKTPIMIFDEMKMMPKEDYKKQQEQFLAHFESWRKSWAEQDVDTYMKYYDQTFRNSEMNYSQWYKHKKKLKKLYSFIKVQFTRPMILMNKDQIVIRMQQTYESDFHKDFGEKTIHARLNPDTGFKIIREDWKPLKGSSPALAPTQQSAQSNQ